MQNEKCRIQSRAHPRAAAIGAGIRLCSSRRRIRVFPVNPVHPVKTFFARGCRPVFFCGNLRSSADDPPFRGFRLRSSRSGQDLRQTRACDPRKGIRHLVRRLRRFTQRKRRNPEVTAARWMPAAPPHPPAALLLHCRGLAKSRQRLMQRDAQKGKKFWRARAHSRSTVNSLPRSSDSSRGT